MGKVVLTNIENIKREILLKTTAKTSGCHSSSTRQIPAYFKANITSQTGFKEFSVAFLWEQSHRDSAKGELFGDLENISVAKGKRKYQYKRLY